MARTAMVTVASVVLACLLVATPYAEGAVTCGQVVTALSPCIAYLKNGGVVSTDCCKGVTGLNNAAKSTLDRQATCGCLKQAATAIGGIKSTTAAALPGKCGVNIPYKISPTTDCSKVN